MNKKPKGVKGFSQALGISQSQLKGLERKYRMEHGTEAEAKLLRWLESTWEESRDKVRLLGRQVGYSETFAGAMHIRGVEGEQEWESVPEHVQAEYSRVSWETFELVKGEELAKRQARSRAERLRQAEIELRQKGKSADRYARTVDDAIDAMRREAKAA